MLEKLITDLKKSLPEPLRKKLGIEDNVEASEEDSDSDSVVSEDTEVVATGSAAPDSSEDKKKKQISMLIRVVVVLCLGYLAVDQFILNPNAGNEEVVDIPVKPRKKKRPPVEAQAQAQAPEETKAQEQSQPSAEMQMQAPQIADNQAGMEKAPAQVNDQPEITSASAGNENFPVDNQTPPVEEINIAPKPQEESSHPSQDVTSGEVKSADTVDKSLDNLIEGLDNQNSSDKKKSKLEDKIVADDEYTPPPSYDQSGRGLVYNCKDKHWSCIDKNSYIVCNKNMKWNKAHGKAAECVIQNVYSTDEDCGVLQRYNVSTSKPTTFCQ